MLKQRILHFFILIPYYVMVSGFVFIEDGDKRMVIVAIISILTSLITYKLQIIKSNCRNPIIWVAVVLAIYAGTMHHVQGGSPGLIRAYACASLLMLFFPRQLLTQRFLVMLSLIGSATLFTNSAYYSLYLNLDRTFGLLNPIPYSTIAASISILSFFHLLEARSKKLKLASFIALTLSISCVILSLTRGIWLALIVTMATMLLITAWRKKSIGSYSLISVLILTGFYFTFEHSVANRIDRTFYELNQINNGNMNTSIGQRLQLWRASFLLAGESPWFGLGSGHSVALQRLYDERIVSQQLIELKNQHYHNQMIDYTVKLGVFGTSLLLLLYLVPIYLAVKKRTPYLSFIIGFVVLYFVAGLTDVPLNHAETILMYLMLIIPLCSKQFSLSHNQEGTV